MAVDFRSHVLRRDEKGLFGIPFKRLLLAGCGGGMGYTILNLVAPGWSIPLAIVIAVIVIILTGLRGGIPLWQRLWYRVRGQLVLAAIHRPQSLAHQLTSLLNISTDHARLDGAVIFAPPHDRGEVDLSEWIIYARSDDTDGLIFVDSPLLEEGETR